MMKKQEKKKEKEKTKQGKYQRKTRKIENGLKKEKNEKLKK